MKRIFCFLVVTLLLMACADDDSFCTDSSLHLRFSTDTLHLDTVFSRTPSSTYSFWVYNPHNEEIRLESVRLKRGNQSGYRVNVDGIYLDNSNGSQTQEVEIHRKDSVLVFVELTAPETAQQSPVLVEDELSFLLESGVEQKVCLQAWAWDAVRLYSPVITTDLMIESGRPVVVYGNLRVETGARLTVRNTTLFFHDGSGIDVYGQIEAENCVFRGDRLDRLFPYLPYDRVSGQWNGIRLHTSSTESYLSRTEIRNPIDGIICDSATIDTTHYRLVMKDCIIHNCQASGISTTNAHVSLNHCQVTNTGGDCISVIGGMVDITNCTLAQFYPFSASRGAALRFSNHLGDTDYPLIRLFCQGSILTGYEDDVMIGEHGAEEATFDYLFQNCLLRSPVIDDSLHFRKIIWESPHDDIEGKKHFRMIDEENLYYDFHLDSLSTAKGIGCY